MAIEVDPRKPRLTITINWNFDGTVSLNCPIEEKMVCLGLLSIAEDEVKAYHRAKLQRIVPHPGLPS